MRAPGNRFFEDLHDIFDVDERHIGMKRKRQGAARYALRDRQVAFR
jgi:hypothetical protein